MLHLGCADWPFTARRIGEGALLHKELAAVCARLIGVDLSAEGIAMLRSHFPEWELNVADACVFVPSEPVDAVVASELIEHLENPGMLLRTLASWVTPTTRLILSTPNAYSLKGASRALCGREYAHPDHVVHFSTTTLTQLLRRTGWQVQETAYYNVTSGRLLASIPSRMTWLLTSLLSPRSGDGVLVSATRVR
ncbi:MAG: class I SAM-dependent methyltransferase [Planctomycetes bacterium]|nr:class I SAM-dependent methyltransferase [Planctomycetota bacterium]